LQRRRNLDEYGYGEVVSTAGQDIRQLEDVVGAAEVRVDLGYRHLHHHLSVSTSVFGGVSNVQSLKKKNRRSLYMRRRKMMREMRDER